MIRPLYVVYLFICLAIPVSQGLAQGTGNHLTLSLQNCNQQSPNTLRFDLYAVSDGASNSAVIANSFQFGVNFDTLILQSGATITASYITNSSDFIPPLDIFNFPVSSSLDHIRILQSIYGLGNTNDTMVVGHLYRVGTFQLTSSANWVANSCPKFSLQASTGVGKTVCAAVVWIGDASVTSSISANGTGDNQKSVSVSCSTLLNADTSVTINGDTLRSNAIGSSYQWIDCESNQPIPNETNQVFLPSQNGSYKVMLTQNVCTATSSCYIFSITSINGILRDDNMIVHPNPNSGIFFIDLPQNKNGIVSVKVFDTVGKVMFSREGNFNDKVEVDLKGISVGIYFLKVNDGFKIYTQKLIIQ